MGRKRKYDSDDPAERGRMSDAASYARHRAARLAQQAEYRQRPEVAERRKAYAKASYPVRYRKMKLDPERYQRHLERCRAANARWQAKQKEQVNG